MSRGTRTTARVARRLAALALPLATALLRQRLRRRTGFRRRERHGRGDLRVHDPRRCRRGARRRDPARDPARHARGDGRRDDPDRQPRRPRPQRRARGSSARTRRCVRSSRRRAPSKACAPCIPAANSSSTSRHDRTARHFDGARRSSRSIIGLVLLASAGTVHADPAGPTDYRSEILSIEPPTSSVTLEVIGGDSFVQLSADPAAEVLVLGYFAEPYLRFLPGGEVQENRNSPTTYQNEERYGSDAPDFAQADADPDWVTVADDGTYAWHDHRAHWMQPIRPAGKAPGDRIVEQVIPLVVDGADVDVTVISVWQDEPSMVPAILGAGHRRILRSASRSGCRAEPRRGPLRSFRWRCWSRPSPDGGSTRRSRRRPARGWSGRCCRRSRSSRRWWRRPLARRSPFSAVAAGLVAASQLAIWAFVKRDGLTAAIVPTDAPAVVRTPVRSRRRSSWASAAS